MNTLAEIQVSGLASPEAAIDRAFEAIAEAEFSLSIWVPGSELLSLNEAGKAVLSEEAFRAVRESMAVARASGGAFDPTLLPGGFEKLRLDPEARTVRLEPGVKLDLSALAKGYAADSALECLRAAGASSALVDLGTSSVALFGEEEIPFAIRNPGGGPSPASFRIREGAIGSSSEEQQGSHILDPRTGGKPSAILAATVVTRTAAEADALSTAVFVLGETEGLALLASRGAHGVVLLEEKGRLVIATTPGFTERYGLELAKGVGTR